MVEADGSLKEMPGRWNSFIIMDTFRELPTYSTTEAFDTSNFIHGAELPKTVCGPC